MSSLKRGYKPSRLAHKTARTYCNLLARCPANWAVGNARGATVFEGVVSIGESLSGKTG